MRGSIATILCLCISTLAPILGCSLLCVDMPENTMMDTYITTNNNFQEVSSTANPIIKTVSSEDIEWHGNHIGTSAEESGVWHFPELEYRIPIDISNDNAYAVYMWPVQIYLDFSSFPVKPDNRTLVLVDGAGRSVLFQVDNFTIVNNQLESFSLWFYVNISEFSVARYYLYYSDTYKDVSGYWYSEDIYPRYVNISAVLYTKSTTLEKFGVMYRLGTKYNFSIGVRNVSLASPISPDPNPNVVGIVWIENPYIRYEILTGRLVQSYNSLVNDSVVFKTGIFNVTYGGIIGHQSVLLPSDPEVRYNTTSLLTDLEDTVNGPYRFESNVIFLGFGTTYNATAPSLEDAKISALIGPVNCRLSFAFAKLFDFYVENRTPIDYTTRYGIYANITYMFFSRQNWYFKEISIHNGYTLDIVVGDRDIDGGSITQSVYYAKYNRFNVSTSEGGSIFQFFSWYDDKSQPPQIAGHEYIPKGSAMGLASGYGTFTSGSIESTYMYWTDESLGHSSPPSVAYIIEAKEFADLSLAYTSQGSYFVNANITQDLAYIYDGMFGSIGLNLAPSNVPTGGKWKIGAVMGVDNDLYLEDIAAFIANSGALDFGAYVTYLTIIFSNPLRLAANISLSSIQAYSNTLYVYAYKTSPSDLGIEKHNISALIRVLYSGNEIPYFDVKTLPSAYGDYSLYIYKPIVTGDYNISMYVPTVFGDVFYSVIFTVDTTMLNGGKISLEAPICDMKFVVSYAPEIPAASFPYPGYVNITLLNSSYVSYLGSHTTQMIYGGTAEIRDIPFGNYTVYYNITWDFMGIDIDESHQIEIDWGSPRKVGITADLGVLMVNVVGKNNRSLGTAEVWVDFAGVESSHVITDPNGFATIMDLPLYNRSGGQYRIHVAYFSDVFNVTVYNETLLYIQDAINIWRRVEIDVFDLRVHAYTYDLFDLVGFKLYFRFGGSGWIEAKTLGPDGIIENVPSGDFISDLEINATYWVENWGVEVYNYTVIGGLYDNLAIPLKLPVFDHVEFMVMFDYLGNIYPAWETSYAEVTMLSTGMTYTQENFNGPIVPRMVPYGETFKINVTCPTKYDFEVNNYTTITVLNNKYDLIMFKLVVVYIYAYPEYDNETWLGKFSFSVSVNNTTIGTYFADDRGLAVLEEFPTPTLYGLTHFEVNSSGFVRGVYVTTYFAVDLSGLKDEYFVGVPQPLSRVSINLRDLYGTYVDADVNMISLDYGVSVAKEMVEGGILELDLIPQGSYKMVFYHYSMWGFVLVWDTNETIAESTVNLDYTLPIREYTIETYDSRDRLLDNVYLVLYLLVDGEPLDYKITGFSQNGVAYFDDLPKGGAYILVNGSRRIVDGIWVRAIYRISTLDLESSTSLNLEETVNKVVVPLGDAKISFMYESIDGPKNVTVESASVRIELLEPAPPLLSEEFSGSSVILEQIPLNKTLVLVVEHETPYGLIASTHREVTFNKSYTEMVLKLDLADLEVRVLGHRDILLNGSTVKLMISSTTIESTTGDGGSAIFRALPVGLTARVYAEIEGVFETVVSEYVDVETGKDSQVEVRANVVDLVLGIKDESGELLRSVLVDIKSSSTILSLTPDTDGLVHVGLVGYGEYVISVYYQKDSATLPTNYSGSIIFVDESTPDVLYIPVTLGEILYSISAPDSGVQGESLRTTIRLADKEGKALSGLDVRGIITNRQGEIYKSFNFTEVEPGIYVANITTADLRHGSYVVRFYIVMGDAKLNIGQKILYIHSEVPQVTLDLQDYLYLGVGVLLFTIVVSALYYRLAKKMKYSPEKGIGRIEKMYAVLLALTILAIVIAGTLPVDMGLKLFDPALSIMVLIGALVMSIVLYGMLIYIDAVKSFLAARFLRSRLVLNGVMYALPLLTLRYIISLCTEIEWTQEYVVETLAQWGPITAPALVISFMTAYLTVYTVLIINSYRDIKTTAAKLAVFRDEGVPQDIIDREMQLQLKRISGGIRIRMLVFLGLLGLSAFSTVPIFQNVAFAIIAIPIALLIIGPYIGQTLINLLLGRKEY